MQPQTKKIIRITAIVLASIIGAMILLVGGYVVYVIAQYYRIDDKMALEIHNKQTELVAINKEYSVMSYNVGFGAYSPEYTFFMDEGEMNDGTKMVGTHAKGISYADVDKNVTGQAAVAKRVNADFYFFQEVDEKADRSYKINMLERLSSAMNGYCYTYAVNFHTANLLYPFNDAIGKTTSGLLTLSRYETFSGARRSFPVTTALIDKLFDLDRCFAVHYLRVQGSDKMLVLINLHMSAYDEGGTIRALQLQMLNEVLAEERQKGNYVIAGGDFNHCLIADQFDTDELALSYFESQQKIPEWVKNSVLHNRELAEGFTIAASLNASTCRGADMTYQKGITYSTVIDGFIVSDNVQVVAEYTEDVDYAYSDHNPVVLKFRLIG